MHGYFGWNKNEKIKLKLVLVWIAKDESCCRPMVDIGNVLNPNMCVLTHLDCLVKVH